MHLIQNVGLKQMAAVDRLLFFSLLLTFFCLPSGISPPTVFVAISLLIWLFSGKCIHFFRYALKLSWTWPILFLVVLTWIGLSYSPDVSHNGLRFAKKTHYYLYSLVIASVSFKIFPVEKLFKAFLWGLTINAIVGILQAVGLIPLVDNQFTGFGMGYRTLSAYLVIGMLYSAHHFGSSSEKRIKIQYAAFMVLFFCHITLLEGRTGYYTFIVLAPLMIHFAFKKLGFLKNVSICLIVVCLMFLSPVVRERVALTVEQLRYHMNVDSKEAWGRVYTKNQDRFFMWYNALHIILEHPVIGIGTGGYEVMLEEKGKPEGVDIAHPHNDLLYMAVSFGMVGIVSYVWLFVEIIKNAWPHRHTSIGNFVISTILVILVSGNTNAQILDAGMILLLSLAAGLQNGLPQFESRASR